MSRDTQSLPFEPEPEPWQTDAETSEWQTEDSWEGDESSAHESVWAVGATGAPLENASETDVSPAVEAEPLDESGEGYAGEDFEDEPRSVDAATWVARGIVVLTIGLLAVVGGLFLGTMLSGSSSTATSTSTTPTATETTEDDVPVPTEVAAEPETQAPSLKVSAAAAAADAAAATTGTAGAGSGTTSGPVATLAPTTAAPSPTATTVPRGKSSNTSKPRPTKGN